MNVDSSRVYKINFNHYPEELFDLKEPTMLIVTQAATEMIPAYFEGIKISLNIFDSNRWEK